MPQMAKASKWIRNVLIGKKEEKDKTRVSSVSAEILATPEANLPAAPKEKKKWSFKKTGATDRITPRRNNSFDRISTHKLVKQSLQDQDVEQIRIKVASTNDANETAPIASNLLTIRLQKEAAAIKIQAFFRSYLAQRALKALRGLVKIQALVRGHLVRKQTASVLISMHALMTIQVRARAKRAQKVEGEEILTKKTSHGKSAPKSMASKEHKNDNVNANMNEKRRIPKSKSGPLYYPKAERMEHGYKEFHSGRVLIPKQEEQNHQIWWSLSAMSDRSSINNDKELEEMFLEMTQKSAGKSCNLSKKKETKLPASASKVLVPETPNSESVDSLFVPSYMSNTESSKAKARSQSEPKERPKRGQKQKSRPSTPTSNEEVSSMNDNQGKYTPSRISSKGQENQHSWPMKLYRSMKPIKDNDIDTISVTTNNSTYGKSLIPFEPPMNLD